MKRTLAALAALAMLAGCSGLSTAWRFQVDMRYLTPPAEDAKPAPGKPA